MELWSAPVSPKRLRGLLTAPYRRFFLKVIQDSINNIEFEFVYLTFLPGILIAAFPFHT